MRRVDLAHVLRASARITGDPHILVIGSQAILGTHDESQLPSAAWMSIEVDVAFLDDPGAIKADMVDGAIGELSGFHAMNAYYAQGVEVTTAVLPAGWRDRLVSFRARSAEPAEAVCLDSHDLVVSKLIARREKDFVFARTLLDAELVSAPVLLSRLATIPAAHAVARDAAVTWVRRYEAGGHRGRP